MNETNEMMKLVIILLMKRKEYSTSDIHTQFIHTQTGCGDDDDAVDLI